MGQNNSQTRTPEEKPKEASEASAAQSNNKPKSKHRVHFFDSSKDTGSSSDQATDPKRKRLFKLNSLLHSVSKPSESFGSQSNANSKCDEDSNIKLDDKKSPFLEPEHKTDDLLNSPSSPSPSPSHSVFSLSTAQSSSPTSDTSTQKKSGTFSIFSHNNKGKKGYLPKIPSFPFAHHNSDKTAVDDVKHNSSAHSKETIVTKEAETETETEIPTIPATIGFLIKTRNKLDKKIFIYVLHYDSDDSNVYLVRDKYETKDHKNVSCDSYNVLIQTKLFQLCENEQLSKNEVAVLITKYLEQRVKDGFRLKKITFPITDTAGIAVSPYRSLQEGDKLGVILYDRILENLSRMKEERSKAAAASQAEIERKEAAEREDVNLEPPTEDEPESSTSSPRATASFNEKLSLFYYRRCTHVLL